MKKEKMAKLTKVKTGNSRGRKTTIAILALALGNAFALTAGTFAWFCISANSSSVINTFSGDLGVVIDKVTAYKYIYPYHKNSTEFIDYDGAGSVKSYVVEDSSIDITGNLSDTVTIALGVNESQAYATSLSDPAISATKLHFEATQQFKYYLMGDGVFNGIATNPWSSSTAVCFARAEAPVVGEPVSIDNIVVSSGAEFVLFDANTVNEGTCNYFTYNSITPENNKTARFSLVESNRIKCLKSGIYSFHYRVDGSGNKFLDINLTNRNDNAIIGTNLIDPTKITIDYRGSVNTTTYPTIESYLPVAIQEQKTMVVLDVKLKYQNVNPVDVGVQIKREAQSAQSIYGFSGKYNTTNSYTYQGYINQSRRNPLKASDFYAYYFVFAKEENAYASADAAWNALHALRTDYQVNDEYQFEKFQNDTSFDTTIECTLHPKTQADTTEIPASSTDNVYHCYIAIDYDYEYMRFFINQNRVGKTYLLDRDFGFYFSATQHLESTPSGGEGD